MTVQPGTDDARGRCEQAQRRIDELVERNREIGERISALRGGGNDGQRGHSLLAMAEPAKVRAAQHAHDAAENRAQAAREELLWSLVRVPAGTRGGWRAQRSRAKSLAKEPLIARLDSLRMLMQECERKRAEDSPWWSS